MLGHELGLIRAGGQAVPLGWGFAHLESTVYTFKYKIKAGGSDQPGMHLPLLMLLYILKIYIVMYHTHVLYVDLLFTSVYLFIIITVLQG